MRSLKTLLNNHPQWLILEQSQPLLPQIDHYFQILQTYPKPPKICLASSEPLKFWAIFFAALFNHSPLFLCNPQWTTQEWQQVLELVQPNLIFGPSPLTPSTSFDLPSLPPHPIMIPTGGTSGKIRFVIHNWDSLTQAVQGFYHYFDQQPVSSFCILPLYHVSGLMQGLRSLLTGGKCAIYSYSTFKKALSNSSKSTILEQNWHDFFISLVPTQLQWILEQNPQWLQQFKTVLVGGAPTAESLLEQAYHHKINIALTYGMTETAAQVATLKPQDFLQKNWCSGQVLPHAKITLQSPQNPIIQIQTSALYWGYYPQTLSQRDIFLTDDLGQFNKQGYLSILGRNSHKIITGGENVFPREVEQAILATKWVKNVCVMGLPDTKWGEVITAIYVPIVPEVPAEKIAAEISTCLTAYKQPKYWLSLSEIPYNNQGKINYPQLKQWAINQLTKMNHE